MVELSTNYLNYQPKVNFWKNRLVVGSYFQLDMQQTLVYTKRRNDLMQAKRRSLHTKKKEKEEGEEFSIAGAGLFQILKSLGYPIYDNVKRVGLEIWVIAETLGHITIL